MIRGINESKTWTSHISSECKCKFDGRKCNSDQKWNNDKCRCEYKKLHACKKYYIWNPSTCNCKNIRYLSSIMDDSTIMCNEIIESYDKETKTFPTNFNEKKSICKAQDFFILLTFLLITLAFLIDARIYCYLIKYRAKKKHLLTFHNTNNELREVLY